MDFSQVKLFGKKNFSDLLKEIHTNQKDKETQLRSLIEGLKPLITSPVEATMIVPLIITAAGAVLFREKVSTI